MAGAHYSIDVSADSIVSRLKQLIERGENFDPLLEVIGEHLLLSHEDRWERQQAPDGEQWQELSPSYARNKKKNKDRILVLDSFLKNLGYQINNGELSFGTNSIYGATHQFGREEAGIPARPFLGLSESDEDVIVEYMVDYMAEK